MADVIEKASVCIVGNDDDWEGLYVNGRLIVEGHSLDARDILDALRGKMLTDHESRICDRQWLHNHGNLPDDLARVKWPRP